MANTSSSSNSPRVSSKATGTFTAPPDFKEGGKEHRKSVLASTSLIVVLLTAENLKPALFGVEVSVQLLWFFLAVGHVYFFVMWRVTSPIEMDTDKRFWNFDGMWKQATLRGTGDFPGKTKAQLILIMKLIPSG